MIGNKPRSRTQMANNFKAMTAKNRGEQTIKAEFDNHSNRAIRKDKPKPLRIHDMAAAASSGCGFAGVRPGRDGSADHQPEGDRESQGEIVVSVADGAIVLEIEHLDDLVTVAIDPWSATNLIAQLSLALSEIQGGEE